MDAAAGVTYMQQRYYDPLTGTFLSVDPVPARSNPLGQLHRYRYANNNPYRFIDPDGRVVVVAGTEQQKDVLNREIHTLRSTPSGEAIYRKLHESENLHTVQPTAEGERNSTTAESLDCCLDQNGEPGDGSGSTIKIEIDPDKISKPIFLAIAHEMGHAGAMDDGILNQDASEAPGGGNTPPSEEQAMEVENNVRREHGVPPRGPYHPPRANSR